MSGFFAAAGFFTFFSLFFVTFASVIGLVKAGAFEDKPGAGADETLEAVFFADGTFAQRPCLYRLEPLKLISTIFTEIIICRHNNSYLVKRISYLASRFIDDDFARSYDSAVELVSFLKLFEHGVILPVILGFLHHCLMQCGVELLA